MSKPRVAVFAAVASGVCVAAYLWLYRVVDEVPCEVVNFGDCLGPTLGVLFVGTPVTYVVWTLLLFWSKVRLPLLLPLAVVVLFVPVARLEPVLWLYPVLAAAAAALWVAAQRPKRSATSV